MNAPLRRAMEIYERDGVRSFTDDLTAHLAKGFVLCTPTAFAMIRLVKRSAPREQLLDPWISWEREADAWFLWLAVGCKKELLRHLPMDLPVGYQRRSGAILWRSRGKLRMKGLGGKKADWRERRLRPLLGGYGGPLLGEGICDHVLLNPEAMVTVITED